MQTNLNTQGQAGAAPAAAVAANVANGTPSELFTTLLVAQIRNQNPLEPTDPSEFVGQLTQLSQMEALQKLVAHGNASASMLAAPRPGRRTYGTSRRRIRSTSSTTSTPPAAATSP